MKKAGHTRQFNSVREHDKDEETKETMAHPYLWWRLHQQQHQQQLMPVELSCRIAIH